MDAAASGARIARKTDDVAADGEVVWFWRPDAGAKSVVRPTDDGGKRARSPGRSRRKPLKPLCRECRWRGQTVVATLIVFTDDSSSSSASAGVFQPSVFLGRALRA